MELLEDAGKVGFGYARPCIGYADVEVTLMATHVQGVGPTAVGTAGRGQLLLQKWAEHYGWQPRGRHPLRARTECYAKALNRIIPPLLLIQATELLE
jgi:hypothetical protein